MNPHKINWALFVGDLREAGLSPMTIAKKTKYARKSIVELHMGGVSQPNYERGCLLADLYRATYGSTDVFHARHGQHSAI